MVHYNTEHKTVLDELLLDQPFVRAGKMFGYPAYYAEKKLCICLYEEGVGIKIPEKTAQQLLETDPNAIPFQPMGKPKMREWIQINLHQSQDYSQYLPLFQESIHYLLEQQKITFTELKEEYKS